MQKAIIHTETRVIRRLTTDSKPPLGEDEEAISLSVPISLEPDDQGNRFFKLDQSNAKVVATQQEIDDADVDESRVATKKAALRQEFVSAIEDLISDGTIPAKYKRFFRAFKAIL